MSHFKAENAPNSISAGAPLQTPLGELVAGGAYSAPSDPLAGFKGPTSKGGRARKGKEEGKRGEEKKRRKGGERGERKGERVDPPRI